MKDEYHRRCFTVVSEYRKISDWKELRKLLKDREPGAIKGWQEYEEEKDNDE